MTTAFFHHPTVLVAELQAERLACDTVLAVQGPGWNIPDFTASWAQPEQRAAILHTARLTEHEPVLSPHLLAVARK